MYTNWKLAFEKGTPEGPNIVCYQVGRGSVHIRGNVGGDGSPFERQVQEDTTWSQKYFTFSA